MKYENMASLVYEWRELRGFSQGSVAKKLGYSSPQFISNIERGLCSFPIKKCKKLCKILDLPYDLLKQAYVADLSEEINKALR
jgi:transcriptional regulator with XRE-family HTH domain